jgi:hypothetical protein
LDPGRRSRCYRPKADEPGPELEGVITGWPGLEKNKDNALIGDSATRLRILTSRYYKNQTAPVKAFLPSAGWYPNGVSHVFKERSRTLEFKNTYTRIPESLCEPKTLVIISL